MALKLPQKPGERISQIIPTVKCSSCGQPVSFRDLGDHVCPPPPSPSTPRPSAILAKIRQASQSISIPGSLNSDSVGRSNSNRSTRTDSSRDSERTARSVMDMAFRRSKTPQPTVTPPPKSTTPVPAVSARPRSSSMSRRPQVIIPPADQITPPLPSSQSAGARLDAPSPSRVGSPLAQPGSPAGRYDALPRSFTPGADPNSRRPSVSSMRGPDSRMRTPPISQSNQPPHTGMSRSAPGSGPMSPASRPSMDFAPPRTSMDRPGSTRPSLDTRSLYDGARIPSPLSSGAQRSPMVSPGASAQSDGEVNMAGVGRRGFQAVAQAALLAASLNSNQAQDRMKMPTNGMDGRRTNAPRHLNINMNVANPSVSSLSPNTPLSTHSPHSPSPNLPNVYSQPGIASSRTPSPINNPFASLTRTMSPNSPDTITPVGAAPASPIGSYLSERSKNKDLAIDTTKTVVTVPPSAMPTSPSESDYSGTGLAYDQETESALSPTSPSITAKQDRVQFPSLDKSSPQHSLKGLPTRSASSSSAYSYASRGTARSTGALERERALETLFEDHVPLPPVPMSPGAAPRSPKLPMRSRTAPIGGSKEVKENETTKKRPRTCKKCTKTIDDGRWIRAEGAGVLCERCWKTMYLPKCRRCNRPIEKQAVSSADGQLKGKYHRDCFNCHKCQEPFPGKEFYVLDGKPYCRYHYHEANDSLCAAPSCGQPIEGACAVAHTGERYHPEHLICEYRYSDSESSMSGGGKTRCTERLEEYWEVDGLMLCERHANMKMEMDIMDPDVSEYGDGDERNSDLLADLVGGLRMAHRDRDSDPDVRAHRRRTQFIDLR